MSQIKTFPFERDSFEQIRKYQFGKNWPSVYVLEDKKEIYIGQSISVYDRSKQHYENPDRRKLNHVHIISDEEFNVSAALDIESWLIQYISADGRYVIQNSNGGLKNHNYYDKVKYRTKFELTWELLREKGIVSNSLEDLKNTDLFKYSPYKSLTEDQLFVAKSIISDIERGAASTFIVRGKPGTGKTILATYLLKYLKDKTETKDLNAGLVVPMASLRKTISRVFSKVKGLKSSAVIGPSDVIRQEYDLLIVDEAHRLQRRKGIMGYGSFDSTNKRLGLDNEGTQLDWIMKSSKYQIFFYDENQSVRPADVRPEDFKKVGAKYYDLSSQMRVEAGEEYIKYIEDIFDLKNTTAKTFHNYDFQIFDNAEEMVSRIKEKDKKYGLSRVVAGYAWPWHTKPGNSKRQQNYDIEIDGLQLVWNSTAQDWVNSPNAVNEVGCIHTVQGYDLNYVGVIIGPEFSYDEVSKKFIVDKQKYFDINGRKGTDPEELERYVINIYKTLLTRGIKGTYVHVVDRNLRKYLHTTLSHKSSFDKAENARSSPSPYVPETISLPMFDSIGCGDFMFADSEVQEMVSIKASLVSKGSKYFILRTVGDSMNKAGVNDGDFILCRKTFTPSEGEKVVALVGDDATLKEFHKTQNSIILRPKSTNPHHQDILFREGDDIKIQGVMVRVLKEEDFNP